MILAAHREYFLAVDDLASVEDLLSVLAFSQNVNVVAKLVEVNLLDLFVIVIQLATHRQLSRGLIEFHSNVFALVLADLVAMDPLFVAVFAVSHCARIPHRCIVLLCPIAIVNHVVNDLPLLNLVHVRQLLLLL